MKILYVGSNPDNAVDLNLAREITELQRRFIATAGNQVSFAFMPDLSVEDLPTQLNLISPDVLHIAAHGETEDLSMSNQYHERIALEAGMLNTFLGAHPPRLVYLNACNSSSIAAEMARTGPAEMVIGSTAPITNHAARSSAVAFYERLFAGFPVNRAFEVGRNMLQALSAKKADMKIYPRPGANPTGEILHPVPVILAEFRNGRPRKVSGEYSCRLGMMGCHPCTNQVIFLTNDESFIQDENTCENDLCLVVRDYPVSGMIWAPREDAWSASGDHALFAICTTADGGCYSTSTTLADALENRFRFASHPDIPEPVRAAIEDLRNRNGAELNPILWDAKVLSKKQNKTKADRK